MTTPERKVMGLAGWEALAHGVFAISITLLVLDIPVPQFNATPTSDVLISKLLDETPRYAAFVFSFFYVGAYWIAFHRSLRMLRGVNHGSLVIGLAYLMLIALVPFVAALLAEYLGADQGRSQVVLIVFIGWQLAVSVLANVGLQWSRRSGLFRSDLEERAVRSWLQIALVGSALWAVALIAALLLGTLALLVPALLLVAFLRDAPVSAPTPPAGQSPNM